MIVDGQIVPYKSTIIKLYSVAEKVLKENFDNVNMSINFVSADEIRELNQKFRGIDRATDVLSFPNLDKKPNDKLKKFANDCDENGIVLLGDVVICKEVAYQQAKDYEHSKKREICFLALHGLLHLLGYDHIKSEDEKLMMSTADKILKQFGVER